MLSGMRSKFGPIVVGIVVGLISFVFVFMGWNVGSNLGDNQAGSVNGDPILLSEYNRELNRRTEMYQSMKLSPEQLKAFGIPQAVFNDLVTRKLLQQMAEKRGIRPSDQEIRETIQKMAVFQTEGKFDLAKYRQLLKANQYTPGVFEDMARKDLQVGYWQRFFQAFSKVSENEIREEYTLEKDRRKVRYVYLARDQVSKNLSISKKRIDTFLKDKTKLALAKSRYESRRNGEYKGKTFEKLKRKIARELLGSENLSETKKLTASLSQKLLGALRQGKRAAQKVLRGKSGLKVEDSDWLTRRNEFLPGVGKVSDLFRDLYAETPLLNPKKGGQSKKYDLPGGVLVAVLLAKEEPDFKKLDSEESQKLRKKLSYRKVNDLRQGWIKELQAAASIQQNPKLF